MKTVSVDEIHLFADPSTDERLLPSFMLQSSNNEELYWLKTSVRIAITRFLTDDQREVIYKRYWLGMSKTAIGNALGITPSAVCKRLRAAHEAIRNMTEYCLEVHKYVKAQSDTENISY